MVRAANVPVISVRRFRQKLTGLLPKSLVILVFFDFHCIATRLVPVEKETSKLRVKNLMISNLPIPVHIFQALPLQLAI